MTMLRLNITKLFLVQLLVAPAFLGPLYYDMPSRNRPYLTLFAMLVAPVFYVAVFAYRAAARGLAHPPRARRSVVYAAIPSGVLFGGLFGLLLVGSLAVLWCRDIFSHGLVAPVTIEAWARGPLLGSFIIVHYLLIGAATGGLVGLAVDAIVRCRSAQLIWGDRN